MKQDEYFSIYIAFEKVWHAGNLFKLRQNGISCNLFSAPKYFLKDSRQ